MFGMTQVVGNSLPRFHGVGMTQSRRYIRIFQILGITSSPNQKDIKVFEILQKTFLSQNIGTGEIIYMQANKLSK